GRGMGQHPACGRGGHVIGSAGSLAAGELSRPSSPAGRSFAEHEDLARPMTGEQFFHRDSACLSAYRAERYQDYAGVLR
ncbi:MAG: hypothetical protein ACRCVA_01160, partial [Phreatobacter sp.]